MTPNVIRHKADAVKPQIPKPDKSYQYQGHVAKTNDKGFCFQDQGNVS